MRVKMCFILCCIFVFAALSFAEDKPAAAPAASPEKAPAIVVPEEKYEFQPVVEGVEVVHDFVIQNKGTADLEILAVKPSCGCTAASFTKQIPPGGEGKITLKLNTEGYGGRGMNKPTLVETNDKAKPKLTLTLVGPVEIFAKIDPRRVSLSGTIEQELKAKVTIIPEQKYAFKVLEAKAERGEHIRVKLEKSEDGMKYTILVDNLKKNAGRYVDRILVKTDSVMRPEIQIDVYGNLFEPPNKKSS